MRVGINVSILSSPITGVGTYVLGLVQALARVDRETEWVLLGVSPSLDGLPNGENVRVIPGDGLTGTRKILWEQLALPRLAARAGVDLLHCPDLSGPLLCSVPVINTIHDLSYYAAQPFFSKTKLMYKRALTSHAIRHARMIITVSNFTKSEILVCFGSPESRIRTIHCGVRPFPAFEKKRANGAPYILNVGTLEERKNVHTLVRAFDILRKRRLSHHRLILVGQPGWGWRRIDSAIQASPFRHDIEVRGYLPREDVLQLYANADVFVFPSYYEGFGSPVVEAMALQTPVICSRATALPEIAGDAAEFFDPASSEDLVRALHRVLSSDELRDRMRREGIERVKWFSYDECARRHCEVYRELVSS